MAVSVCAKFSVGGGGLKPLAWACQSSLEQDTELQIAPDEQLAPRYQCVNGWIWQVL